MAPRKLSDSDKSDIVDLYKQPEQTTSTLAEQFGVSNSTISRILKTALPSDEYSELIAHKRMSSGTASKTQASSKRSATSKRSASKASSKASSKADVDTARESSDVDQSGTPVEPPKLKKETAKESTDTISSVPRRRRSRKKDADDGQLPLLDQGSTQEQDDVEEDMSTSVTEEVKDKKVVAPPVLVVKSSSDEDDDDEDDLEGLDETIGDDFGDDDDDLEEDEDDLDDDDEFEVPPPKLQTKESVEIMPLGTAKIPKPCYLVVDMRAELITCPLSEFGHLGRIPSDEEKSTTLPVFDNHRVARRFSRNKQRVIKVPDGNLITRTRPYLQAKGITRLLVNGQVFDLVSAE
ncbi:Helix-turn-helix domain of resolvase protein [Synechococcus sp. PCC 7335]|uniref:hypothetical protein n=1 Tax=Synechococcus sp. (strain ATCC 29403 / PCC 7335) TaxID=91464 RepID=UPI00017ECE64|nr:hypothetical protein [Synechococcus sp. PCC 7335]EDX83763.1 Helix-turn-helix domain of resolvase protein [Synechococcus sp. PCC 7335]